MLLKENKLFLDAKVELAAHGFLTTIEILKGDDVWSVRGRTKQKPNDDGRRAVPVRLYSSLMIMYLLDSRDAHALYPYQLHIEICFITLDIFTLSFLLILGPCRIQFFTF